MTTHYFAYGSNMNPERMRARAVPFLAMAAAALPDHTLVFDKRTTAAGVGHANIRFERGAVVHGVLYTLADAHAIRVLDPYERAPVNYGREIVIVHAAVAAERVPVAAWTYVGNPGVLAPDLLPERSYLDHLLAGAPLLPPDYLHALRARPCHPTLLPTAR